jgi:hypothetical protein
MTFLSQKQLRYIGAIALLSLIGTAAALMPISIYAIFVEKSPTQPLLYFLAAICGGGVIGWVMKK